MKKIYFLITLGWVIIATIYPSHAQGNPITPRLGDVSRPLNSEFFCMNVNVLSTAWNDSLTNEHITHIQPSLLRIPGGTVANYWDWQAGWANAPRYASITPTPVMLSDFKAGFDATATIPLWGLNLLTSDLETELTALREARDLGMTIRYIELGNELDFPFREETTTYPQASDYGQTVVTWIQAIQTEFPEAKIAINGASQQGANMDNRQMNWNAGVMPLVSDYNVASTLHIYAGVPLRPNQSLSQNALVDIFSMPFVRWQMVKQFDLPQIPSHMPIWITEFNSYEAEENIQLGGTWAQGLFTTTMALLFLEEARIELICSHVLTGNMQWSAFFYQDVPESSAIFEMSAQGYALSFLGYATHGMTSARPIIFENTPTATNQRNDTYPTLIGWQFADALGTSKTLLLNLSSSAITLSLEDIQLNNMPYQAQWSDPLRFIGRQDMMTYESGITGESYLMQPYSMAVISAN